MIRKEERVIPDLSPLLGCTGARERESWVRGKSYPACSSAWTCNWGLIALVTHVTSTWYCHRHLVAYLAFGEFVFISLLRYDFFLVSQSVRQGTVTPTHFNVIYDTTGLKPDHIQRLTYKLCHLYYNWPVRLLSA